MKILPFKNSNSSGFTLIEILIVIGIIGILSGVLVSVINPAGIRAKSRDAQRKSDLRQIQTALELYFADNRMYPEPVLNGCAPGNTLGCTTKIDGNDNLTDEISPSHISAVPLDPKLSSATNQDVCSQPTQYRYNYMTDASKSIYVLTAIMEAPDSNDESTCHSLYNWNRPDTGPHLEISCRNSSGYVTANVCYGLQNP